MSHFDDIEPIFYGGGSGGGIFSVIFLIIAIGCCYWACQADEDSKNNCESHGEKYIDSRSDYTLCEQDGGTVIRR